MSEITEKLIISCLYFRSCNFSLPFSESFVNYELHSSLNDEKKAIKIKFKHVTSIKKLVQLLGLQFDLNIHLIYYDELFISGNCCSDFFIFINKYVYLFHENAGKIVKLPAGVGKKSYAIHCLKEMLNYKFKMNFAEKGSSLSMDSNLKAIEDQYEFQLEIWQKKGDKIENLRKSKNEYEKKLHLHFDPATKKLFLIKNHYLYFRGHLKFVKNYYD